MKINQIWTELENDLSVSHGLLLRRYSGSVQPDVFIALKSPEKFRCLATVISNSANVNVASFSNLRDISVELIPDEKKRDKNILLFKLLNSQHTDVFSVLCEDLITSIASVRNETQLIKELLNRFERWKSLFDRAAASELSSEEQRGLFGELLFLRKFLQTNPDFSAVVNSWVGSEKQIRDFQYGNWSVEIKTTHGNDHNRIHVSSERQLDTKNLDNLFIYHISLDARQQSGETLNQIVDSVFKLLATDAVPLNRFRNKLLEAGYFERHRQVYSNTGYFIRQDVFYKVENEFPRIEEADIRNGVGDVKYSVVVSQCSDYIRAEEHIFRTLNFS